MAEGLADVVDLDDGQVSPLSASCADVRSACHSAIRLASTPPASITAKVIAASGTTKARVRGKYSAVILCGLACAWVLGSATGWLTWAALVIVLTVKATLEERWMLVQHPEYAAYRTRTWRFVPGLF